MIDRYAEGIEELSGTTEIQRQAGSVRYLPPKEVEHITDHYRCLMSAAIRYNQMVRDNDEADFENDFGWAPAAAPGWRAPWGR